MCGTWLSVALTSCSATRAQVHYKRQRYAKVFYAGEVIIEREIPPIAVSKNIRRTTGEIKLYATFRLDGRSGYFPRGVKSCDPLREAPVPNPYEGLGQACHSLPVIQIFAVLVTGYLRAHTLGNCHREFSSCKVTGCRPSVRGQGSDMLGILPSSVSSDPIQKVDLKSTKSHCNATSHHNPHNNVYQRSERLLAAKGRSPIPPEIEARQLLTVMLFMTAVSL